MSSCSSARWLALSIVVGAALTAQASGTITGQVFRDYDADGVRDTLEPGVNVITVSAYDGAGVLRGTTFSTANGTYSLVAAGTGPYRLQFTNLPSYLRPGAFGGDSGTTVQFVPDGNSTNIDVGFANPAQYCDATPLLATPDIRFGHYVDQGGQTVLERFPYSAGGNVMPNYGLPAPTGIATGSEIGATYGLAYDRTTDVLYAGALMKRHTGFGPSGPGAIYAIANASSGAPGPITTFATIANPGVDPHSPTPAMNGPADFYLWYFDVGGFLTPGTRALGDVEITDDGSSLFTVNLNTRELIEIPIATGVPVSRGVVPHPGCNANDHRPFALGMNDGVLYVGGVCSAETSQNVSHIRMYVYSYEPSSLTFSASPVLNEPLNYTRMCATNQPLPCSWGGDFFPAAWKPWITTVLDLQPLDVDTNGYPSNTSQAIFSDITFVNGDMVLGLRDRWGDQLGDHTGNPANPSDPVGYNPVPAGDTLRAAPNGLGGWTLESNSSGATFGPTAGAGTGEGPGNGEFYFQDNWIPSLPATYNDELSTGGLTHIPGYPDVVTTAYDAVPNEAWDGGIQWYDNANGTRTKSYGVYDNAVTPNTMAKANGLGDLEALCDPAPLEIGNRVWRDNDGDGVQDSGEPVLAGVTVELWKAGMPVASTVTNAQGEYYFTASNVPGGILPNMTYVVRINTTQGALTGLSPTIANGNPDDSIDSDGTVSGSYVEVSTTTGDAGDNCHDYDFGFALIVATTTTTTTSTSTSTSSSSTSTSTSTSTTSTVPTTTSTSTSTSSSSSTSSTSTTSTSSSTSTSSTSTSSTSSSTSTSSSSSTSSTSTSTSSSSSTSSTSTSTTSTSSTSSSSTSSTSTSTTSTTTIATTTTTTLPPVCHCDEDDVAYLSRRFMKQNNDGYVGGNIGVNEPGGFLRLSRNVFQADGFVVEGDRVEIGDGSSVWMVAANSFRGALGSTIRGALLPSAPSLPLVSPFCPIPPIDDACAGPDIVVNFSESIGPIPAGTYGRLFVRDGATVRLGPGTTSFCDVKVGKAALIQVDGPGQSTVNIGRRFQLGDGTRFLPQSLLAPIPYVNLAGRKIRLGEAAEITAWIAAPLGKLTMGRDSMVHGSLCVDFMKTDKHTRLDCPCDLP